MTRRVVGIAFTMDDSATHDLVYVACDDGMVFNWCPNSYPDGRIGGPGRWEELAPVPGTQAARQADKVEAGAKAEPEVADRPDVDGESLNPPPESGQ